MEKNGKEINIDIEMLFHYIIKRAWFIFLIGAIFVSAAVAINLKTSQETKYEASGKIITVGAKGNILQIAELVKSNEVLNDTIEEVGLEISSDELLNMMEVNVTQDTSTLEVIVRNSDASIATNTINSVLSNTERLADETIEDYRISILGEASVPTTPLENKKNEIVWFLVGVIISVCVIVIKFVFDDTIKTKEDVEIVLEVDTLAVIPELNRKKRCK